jgi:hypothetical protein
VNTLESIKHSLQHPDWKVRNSAIKKCGTIQSKESIEFITIILKDLKPASWWRVLLGDPYYQVGFIRRNAWRALKNQDLSEFPLDELCIAAMNDPYYEVRAECLSIILHAVTISEYTPSVQLKDIIREGLWKEQNIDICLSLFPLCHMVMDDDEILMLGHKVLNYKNWRLRAAFLNNIILIAENNNDHHESIQKLLSKSNLMSEYFRPIFQLKLKQSELQELINTNP